MSEEIEIRLRNHRNDAATVIAKERLYRWVKWTIAHSTHQFDQEDSRTVRIPVRIPPGGESTLRHTVQYTW